MTVRPHGKVVPRPAPGLACPVLAAALGLAACLAARDAPAAGFEYGPQGVHAIGRGGAFTVAADDPTAMWWNPSRLALQRGTNILVNYSLPMLSLDFQRSPTRRLDLYSTPAVPVDPAQYSGPFAASKQQNKVFPSGVSAVVTSDFGLKDWTFGLGMFGPSAVGKVDYPAGSTAATRYSFEHMDVLLAYVAASAAWKYRDIFGIGATLQYVIVPTLKYSLVIVGPGSAPSWPTAPTYTTGDLRADVSVKDNFAMTAEVGAWYRPWKFLEIGASSRVAPVEINATGSVKMSGDGPQSVFVNASPINVPAKLKFVLPPTFRGGVRYRHLVGEREVFDVEADFAWEQWSRLDAFRTSFPGAACADDASIGKLGLPCAHLKGSSTNIPLYPMTLTRNWKDTYSVRVGGQWNAIPKRLIARLGWWWESAAQPLSYTMIDLPSWDRFGLGFGLSTEWRGVEVAFSYMHIFQLSRTVSEGQGRVYQQQVTNDGYVARYPVNEGRYTSSIDVASIGLTLHFNDLIHGERP